MEGEKMWVGKKDNEKNEMKVEWRSEILDWLKYATEEEKK